MPRPKRHRAYSTHDHEHTTLADFEELYIRVGGSNYGWYQGKFVQRVREVFATSGISFMQDLRRSLADNQEAAEVDPLRLRELEALSEGFITWAEGPGGERFEGRISLVSCKAR